ncbi:hypothetical protein [Lentzea cavernae]|uniref:Uncharacterized protein n=1 Tax=Lentzea cavernae TaxID=2020703 RepID=A0ABQ3MNU2_9PSEU|nr:hypothetical protein [Lentzea cavernae]GHH50664.1 hypothetical protein GCM10017774_60100 [Lentzea cavernae]
MAHVSTTRRTRPARPTGSTSGAEAHLPFGGDGRSGNGSRQPGVSVLDRPALRQSANSDRAGAPRKTRMDTLEIEADLDHRLA